MKKVNYKEGNVAYYTIGSGNPIVLLHGYCEDSFIFFHVAKKLHKKHRFILIDLPGYGESDVATVSQPDMRYYADAVKQVLKQEGINKAVFGGHSMGGYILLHLLEKNPELFEALILINSHCFADTEEKIENRKKSTAFVEKNGTTLFLQEFYRNLFPATYKDRKIIQTLLERGKKIAAKTIIQSAEAMIARKDKSAVLMNCNIPVLQFSGGNDNAIAKELSLKMATLPANLTLSYHPAFGHMSFFENKKFAEELEEFCGWVNGKKIRTSKW